MKRVQSRGSGQVEVRGLRELQKSLREADKSLPRLLRKANKDIAEIVVDTARARATGLGGSAAKSAPSIKARGEQRNAKITFGGARYPFAPGANFGSKHNIPRNTAGGRQVLGWNQFPKWGGNQWTGGANDRFIYWSIRKESPQIMDEYENLGERLRRLIEGN